MYFNIKKKNLLTKNYGVSMKKNRSRELEFELLESFHGFSRKSKVNKKKIHFLS